MWIFCSLTVGRQSHCGTLHEDSVRCSSPRSEDRQAIVELFSRTFADAEGHAEGQSIARLVQDLLGTTAQPDLYCFVAREEDQIVGSIVFSRLQFETGIQAFILAPVAVATECQGRGMGQALIAHGLATLERDGVELVIVYGDPAFYAKAGFQPVAQAVIPAPCQLQQPHGWQAQSLTGDAIRPIHGGCTCVEALNRPDYW